MAENTDYQVLVWKRNEHYYGGISELGILESNDDIQSLWRQIEERKQELVRKFADAGISDELPPPQKGVKRFFAHPLTSAVAARGGVPSMQGGLMPTGLRVYVVKALVVVVGVMACFFIASQYLEAAVHKLTAKKIVVRQIIEDYAGSLDTLPVAKRESLHRSLQAIASNLRPFVKDLRPLLNEWSSSGCSDSCPEKGIRAGTTPDQSKRR